MLKIAERVARSFFNGLTSSMGSTFSGVAGEDIRVMTMKSVNDLGKPPGIILCAATSFWVPVPPQTVFDYLRDETNRAQVYLVRTRLFFVFLCSLYNMF